MSSIGFPFSYTKKMFQMQEDSFVAHFKYHTLPITSIEWSPHEASTLGVTSADHQLTYSSKLLPLTLPEAAILASQYFCISVGAS